MFRDVGYKRAVRPTSYHLVDASRPKPSSWRRARWPR